MIIGGPAFDCRVLKGYVCDFNKLLHYHYLLISSFIPEFPPLCCLLQVAWIIDNIN